jgi:hypothetical protein
MRIRRMAAAAVLLAGFMTPAAAMVVIRRPAPYRPARRVVVVRRPRAMAAPVVIAGRPHGAIDLDVTPGETLVWVDGKLRGKCDDFDGVPSKLYLLPGIHTLELKTPGGEAHLEKLRIVAGQEINLSLSPE